MRMRNELKEVLGMIFLECSVGLEEDVR